MKRAARREITPHPRNKFLVAAKIAVKSQFVAAKDDVTGICRNSAAIRP